MAGILGIGISIRIVLGRLLEEFRSHTLQEHLARNEIEDHTTGGGDNFGDHGVPIE